MSNATEVASRNGVFGTLVSVPVVILNGLTLIWMIQMRHTCKKQKVLFIGHLSADLCVGFFTLIEAQASYYGRTTIELCYVNCYVNHTFGIVTSLMALLQTTDKFLILRVTYCYTSWATWQKILILVIFVYIFSVAAVVCIFFFEFDANVFCSIVTIFGIVGHIFVTSVYIFCIFVSLVLWIYIGKILKKHRLSINDTVLSGTVIASEIKYAMTLGIIMCLYGLCFMPSIVYLCLVLQEWDTREQYVRENPTTPFIVFILINSLLNPIIYIWRMKFYRNSCVSKFQEILSSVRINNR